MVDRLYSAIAKATADTAAAERTSKMAMKLHLSNSTEIVRFMREEAVRMRLAIKENNIKLENWPVGPDRH